MAASHIVFSTSVSKAFKGLINHSLWQSYLTDLQSLLYHSSKCSMIQKCPRFLLISYLLICDFKPQTLFTNIQMEVFFLHFSSKINHSFKLWQLEWERQWLEVLLMDTQSKSMAVSNQSIKDHYVWLAWQSHCNHSFMTCLPLIDEWDYLQEGTEIFWLVWPHPYCNIGTKRHTLSYEDS